MFAYYSNEMCDIKKYWNKLLEIIEICLHIVCFSYPPLQQNYIMMSNLARIIIFACSIHAILFDNTVGFKKI